jgi:hypothetical protein
MGSTQAAQRFAEGLGMTISPVMGQFKPKLLSQILELENLVLGTLSGEP